MSILKRNFSSKKQKENSNSGIHYNTTLLGIMVGTWLNMYFAPDRFMDFRISQIVNNSFIIWICFFLLTKWFIMISILVNYSKQNDFVHMPKIWSLLGGYIMLNSILLMMLLMEEFMKMMHWIQTPISPIYCIMVPFGICCIIHFCHIIRDEEFNKAVKKFDMTTPSVWSTNINFPKSKVFFTNENV